MEKLKEKGVDCKWEAAMADVPEFKKDVGRSGDFVITDRQIEDIYRGDEVYGADEIDFCGDKEKADRLIEEMQGWGNVSVFMGKMIGKDAGRIGMTPDELIDKRQEIVRGMADYIVDVYGIEKAPEVEISDELGISDGGYKAEENKVYIDMSSLRIASSPDNLLRSLAHELMHCYDETVVKGNGSELGEMIKYNSEHYYINNEDMDGYEMQLNERRAFSREKEVMRQFENYTHNIKN